MKIYDIYTISDELPRRHADVLKWMIDHPAATQRECARAMGYSETWLSRIINSPPFRTEYRRVMDEQLRQSARKFLRID